MENFFNLGIFLFLGNFFFFIPGGEAPLLFSFFVPNFFLCAKLFPLCQTFLYAKLFFVPIFFIYYNYITFLGLAPGFLSSFPISLFLLFLFYSSFFFTFFLLFPFFILFLLSSSPLLFPLPSSFFLFFHHPPGRAVLGIKSFSPSPLFTF